MVSKITCDCESYKDRDISTIEEFDRIKRYFKLKVNEGLLKEIPVEQPYYVGEGKFQKLYWYADKWYTCKVCGCLWELVYPDFPMKGSINKFSDGIYRHNY